MTNGALVSRHTLVVQLDVVAVPSDDSRRAYQKDVLGLFPRELDVIPVGHHDSGVAKHAPRQAALGDRDSVSVQLDVVAIPGHGARRAHHHEVISLLPRKLDVPSVGHDDSRRAEHSATFASGAVQSGLLGSQLQVSSCANNAGRADELDAVGEVVRKLYVISIRAHDSRWPHLGTGTNCQQANSYLYRKMYFVLFVDFMDYGLKCLLTVTSNARRLSRTPTQCFQ